VPGPQVKLSAGLDSLPCVGVDFSGSCLWPKGSVGSAAQKRRRQIDVQDNDDGDKKCGDSP